MDGYAGRVYDLDFSADGNLLASGSHDGTIQLRDVATRRATGSVNHRGEWRVFFVRDDAHVVSGKVAVR